VTKLRIPLSFTAASRTTSSSQSFGIVVTQSLNHMASLGIAMRRGYPENRYINPEIN